MPSSLPRAPSNCPPLPLPLPLPHRQWRSCHRRVVQCWVPECTSRVSDTGPDYSRHYSVVASPRHHRTLQQNRQCGRSNQCYLLQWSIQPSTKVECSNRTLKNRLEYSSEIRRLIISSKETELHAPVWRNTTKFFTLHQARAFLTSTLSSLLTPRARASAVSPFCSHRWRTWQIDQPGAIMIKFDE
jgi:hypothetical protein